MFNSKNKYYLKGGVPMAIFKRIFTKKKILFIILLAIALVIIYFFYTDLLGEKTNLDIDNIQRKITSLGELNTIEYYYQNLLSFEDSKELRGIKLPFTTKSLLIMYEGYIKAGVDLREAEIEVEEDIVILHLRKSVITNNVIKEDRVKIYDEKSGLFNPLKIKEVFQLLDKEKNKVQEELIEGGFLEEANQRAEKLIRPLLLEMDFKEVVFDFY